MSTVFRTNGGIINSVLKSGQLRFFKIIGGGSNDFSCTMSDGTVNLPPQYVTSGLYTVVPGLQLDAAGNPIPFTGQPVPNSAAEYVLKALSEKCEIVGMSLVYGGAVSDGVTVSYTTVSEIHIACTTHNFGWGLAIDPGTGVQWVSAEAEMTAAVNALPPATVYLVATGAPPVPPVTQDSLPPNPVVASFTTMTVTEVSLVLI